MEQDNISVVSELVGRGNMEAMLDSDEAVCAGLDMGTYTPTLAQLSWPLVMRMGRDVASGVRFLHSQGIIHSEVKPSKILMYL